MAKELQKSGNRTSEKLLCLEFTCDPMSQANISVANFFELCYILDSLKNAGMGMHLFARFHINGSIDELTQRFDIKQDTG